METYIKAAQRKPEKEQTKMKQKNNNLTKNERIMMKE